MFFNINLKYLRQLHNVTQQELGDAVGVSRKNIGAYEANREPRLDILLNIANYFNVSLDDLMQKDLREQALQEAKRKEALTSFAAGDQMRVLSITVDHTDEEYIEMVPEKASAGYSSGFADPEYLRELPKYQLPFLDHYNTYRAFELSGDSMLPLQSGDIVIGMLVTDWTSVKDGDTCILVTAEGIVFKQVFNTIETTGKLLLKSTNPIYPHYDMSIEEVREVWKYTAHIGRAFPDLQGDEALKQAVETLKDQLYKDA
ncbi:helix-turn-helix domain-containing protein [Algivirga pacifica]|uniref:HTH cro/C1-type domain-containing protein n=1 Tax=Algivirga pacifica TaxID=1162670 RepID=A0ABP9DIA7_9BACT